MAVGLGDGSIISSALFSASTIFRSALLVLSPASNVRVVEDGGSVKIVIISLTAWRKNRSY